MTWKLMRTIRILNDIRRMRYALPFLALLLIGAPLAGAAGAQQQTPVVENGRNGSMRTAPTLTEKATAGMEGPEESLLYQPGDMLFGPDKNLYVPDRGAHAVLVYSLSGTFIRRIGKEGAGPGELRMPMGVYFDEAGELVVPDIMNQRTTIFSAQGEFLRSEPMGQNGVIVIGAPSEPLGDGTYVQAGGGGGMMVVMRVSDSGGGGPPALPDPDPIQIKDAEGNLLREFGLKKEHENPQVARMLNSASLAVNARGREVALAYRYTSDIAVYDVATGQQKRIITRRLPFTPMEPKLDEVRTSSPGGNRTEVSISPVGDTVTYDAVYDAQGRLWTITSVVDNATQQQKDEDGDYTDLVRLEVYDPTGKLLTAIPLADPANRLAFDPNGDLWLMDSQYLGTLKKYEVRWP